MPHKFFLIEKPGADYHKGEYRRDETFEEHLALCEHETTRGAARGDGSSTCAGRASA